MTRKWYATLRHPKMHPHTKFGIPTSKNIGDMDRKRKRDGRTDGLTDGQMDGRTVRLLYASQSSFGGIKSAQMSVVTFILIYNGMRTVRNYDTPQCPGLTDLAINDHV